MSLRRTSHSSGVAVIAAGVATFAAGAAMLARVARRSGVTTADLTRRLPGDELVADADLVIDRATILQARPADVWPWIVQLGKGRGGWYMPGCLEWSIPDPAKRGARAIVPGLQGLAVGAEVPDWGPGAPVFRVDVLDPPHALVYRSLRQRSRGWTWPETERPLPPDAMAFSWALIVEDAGQDHSRLHVRLRATSGRGRISPLFRFGGGLVDYATLFVLFAGLRERLGQAAPSTRSAGLETA
jgi:hypothetical protein